MMLARKMQFLTGLLSAVAAISAAGCDTESSASAQIDAGTTKTAPLTVEQITVEALTENTADPNGSDRLRFPILVKVETAGATPGVDLAVKLVELSNGEEAAVASHYLKADTTAVTALTLKRSLPWRPGRYLVETTMDGALVGQQDIDLFDHDDPTM